LAAVTSVNQDANKSIKSVKCRVSPLEWGVPEENAHPMQSQGLITSGTSPAPRPLPSIKIKATFKRKKLPVIPGGYLLGITGKKTMENGMPVPVGYLFSEMPHEILHFVNVPPNTLRKVLEAFTDVMNICRGPNRGCGWTCSGLF
jgi:hypothetical protein